MHARPFATATAVAAVLATSSAAAQIGGSAPPLFDLIPDGLIENDPIDILFNGGLDAWGYDASYAPGQAQNLVDIHVTHPDVSLTNPLIMFLENNMLTGGTVVDRTVDALEPGLYAGAVPPTGGTTDPDSPFQRIYEMRQFDLDGGHFAGFVLARHQMRDKVLQWDYTNSWFDITGDVGTNETSASCDCEDGGSGTWIADNYVGTPLNPAPCNRRWSTGQDHGDIDGDGDEDLVICYRDGRPRYFENDGSGNFTEAQVLPQTVTEITRSVPKPGLGNRDIHLVDLDQDGHLDVLVARMHGANSDSCQWGTLTAVIAYRWNPSLSQFDFWYELQPAMGSDITVDLNGNYVSSGLGSSSLSISPGDLNGDGFPDLIQPMLSSPDGDRRVRVYMNNGRGELGLVKRKPDGFLGLVNRPVAFVGLEDLDADGDLDVVLCFHQGAQAGDYADKVYLNQGGTGAVPNFVFEQDIPSQISGQADNTRYVRFADLDNDGDKDYIESNFEDGTVTRVFFNTTIL